MKKIIDEYINNEIEILHALDVENIISIIDILIDALNNEKRIFIFGNGGSGSTASHINNDFNKAIFKKTDKTFKFNCLNDNVPLILAIANDEGYDEVFKYQLKNIGINKNDIVIAISGSGNSQNIIKAVSYAKRKNATIISLTGYDGGKLKKISDYNINSNIEHMQITEDIHLFLEHLIISVLYKLYGKGGYLKDE